MESMQTHRASTAAPNRGITKTQAAALITEEAATHISNPMKISHTILVSLARYQATSSVIAEDLRLPEKVVDAFCQDLEIDGLIDREKIGGAITAWRITDAGRQVANSASTPVTV